MRKWINLMEGEQPDDRLDMWEMFDHYGVEPAYSKFQDVCLPWINRNSISCINRAVKNKKFRLLSKLLFWSQHVLKERNFGVPLGTPQDFETALPRSITLWRAGGGTYDPNHIDSQERDWVSFTASEKRTTTFSEYHGTIATRAYSLRKRTGPWWIAEINIPLDQILLFLPMGGDDEVILSKETASGAKVIRTNNA